MLILSLSFLACSGGTPPEPAGLTFTGQPRLDAELPAELSAGLVGAEVGTFADDVAQAAARLWMVMPPPGGDCTHGNPTLIPLAGRDKVISPSCSVPVKQLSVLRYQSIIDSGGRIAGNFAVGEVDTSGNRKVEVVVTDMASAFVTDDCLADAVASLSAADMDAIVGSACDVVVAQGVTLTSILSKTWQKVEANAAVTGLAFGVDGQVFASNEAYSLDYRLRISPYVPLRSYVAVATALANHETIQPVEGDKGKTSTSILTIPAELAALVNSAPTSSSSTWASDTAALAFIQQSQKVTASYTSSFDMKR